MPPFQLERETFIPADIQTVWHFFSNPENLKQLTPKDLNFRVTHCPKVDEIYEGMLIEYLVSPLLRIPLKWITLIKKVKPMSCFTDTQIRGPYRLWEHTHTFEAKGNGVLMKDKVLYKLPFGPLGLLAHRLFVKKQLEGIFKYRALVIQTTFPMSQ
jgi:ligand-binding SRPBCC domain-containing protein